MSTKKRKGAILNNFDKKISGSIKCLVKLFFMLSESIILVYEVLL